MVSNNQFQKFSQLMNGSVTLLKEWSIWLVGLQSTVTTLLFGFADKSRILEGQDVLVKLAISSFALSIFISTWLIGAIADKAIVLDDKSKIHEQVAFRYLPNVKIWIFASAQHLAFSLGLIFLLVATWI